MSSSCFCQTKRAKTMADAYKANYEYMLQSPLMQELYNKNKKLERANMALVRVIIRLSNDLEKQGSTIKATKRSNHQTANIDEPEDDDVSGLSTSNVEITEPIIVHKLDANNDVNNHSPNIVYELEEEGCEVEEEEEAEVEAEGCEVEEAEEEAEEEEEEGEEEAEEEEEEGEVEEGEEEEGEEEEGEVEVEEGCEVEEEEGEEAEGCEVEVEGEEAEGCEVEVEGEEEEGCEVEGEVEVAEDADEVLEEETEVVEITIRSKKYFTTNTTNGEIYAMDANGDVGDEVGQFVNGSAKFTKK